MRKSTLTLLVVGLMCVGSQGLARTPDSIRWYVDQADLSSTNAPDEAYAMASRGMRLAHQLGKPEFLVRAYRLMADARWERGLYREAQANYTKSLQIAEELGDSLGYAAAIHGLGKVSYRLANYQESLSAYLEAARIQQSFGDSSALAQTYLSLGILQAELKRYPEAHRHYQNALRLCSDRWLEASIYNHIGRAYRKNQQYPEARTAHGRSLQLFRALEDSSGIARNFNNLGSIYRREGNYPEALEYFWQSLTMHKSRNNMEALADGYNDIAKTYLQMGKLKQALQYAKEGLELAQEAGLRDDERYALENLAWIYEVMGNYKMAWETQIRHDSLKDSLFNANKLEQLAQLHLLFERQQQQNEIELLKRDKVIEAERRAIFLISGTGIILILLILAGVYYYRYRLRTRSNEVLEEKNAELDAEKKKSEALLLNILPAETANELLTKGFAAPRRYQEVTVLFSDFKNFSRLSETLSAEALVEELDYCFQAFDAIMEKYGIEKIKTIGDAYMCAAGLPKPQPDHALRMVEAALDMQDFLVSHRETRKNKGLPFFEARIGIHTGPVVAGVVGSKKFAYDIWSDTVNTASRMESCGKAGEVNISYSTYLRVKDQFDCTSRGKVKAKGKGEIEMFFIKKRSRRPGKVRGQQP